MSKSKDDNSSAQSKNELEDRLNNFSKAIVDFHPYNRKLFEQMTREERRAYNNAFKLTGGVLVIGGTIDILFSMILNVGCGEGKLMIIIGIGLLCYWNNPLCFSNLWKMIKKRLP